MHRKLSKDRVFRHMAKDAPDEIRFKIDRDDLIDKLGYDLPWRDLPSDPVHPWLYKKYLKNWMRLMAIKHEAVEFQLWTYQDFDIDYNRYRIGAYVRTIPVRRISHVNPIL